MTAACFYNMRSPPDRPVAAIAVLLSGFAWCPGQRRQKHESLGLTLVKAREPPQSGLPVAPTHQAPRLRGDGSRGPRRCIRTHHCRLRPAARAPEQRLLTWFPSARNPPGRRPGPSVPPHGLIIASCIRRIDLLTAGARSIPCSVAHRVGGQLDLSLPASRDRDHGAEHAQQDRR